jgi:hypothetical protein
MPATKKLTIAALLVATVSVAGCHSGSKHASTAETGAATSTAAVPAASGAAAASSGAAAGASAPAAAGASTSGGCPLTAAQVTAAMGVTYAAPTSADGICTYVGTDGNALSIQVLKASGANDFAGTLATAVQDNGTQTTTAIPGVGDKATGVGLEIVVQSGGQIIDIRSADSPGFGNWPKSVALAKLVIAGLH